MAHGEDKTEAPTPKKKRDARKKGQIAKSPELVGWVSLFIGTFFVEKTVSNAGHAVRDALSTVAAFGPNSEAGDGLKVFGAAMKGGLLALAPLLAAMVLLAVVGNLAQTNLFVSLSMLKPKPERLNPIQGFKKLFSAQSAWQLGKTLVKTAVLALSVWGPLHSVVNTLAQADHPSFANTIGYVAGTALSLVRRVAAIGMLIGVLDYAWQRRKINKQLKMSKQELKEEHKQAEGDPHTKGKIRRRQMEMSRNRMIADVANAAVVVVNPTHIAVALGYDVGANGAPKVLAKGKGEIAARIRAAAEEHKVPIVRNVPLARTLESSCDVGAEIPFDLYEAVARLLAFVFTIGKRAAFGGVLQMAGS
jgi:flagellar biosynthetic protein FlhB